ncbi:ABC-F family ATP-binding cassette domain-containing protein [Hymenobacter properus]|uniref:ABC-F family ATP-binding cassette domain-containing protein n=1 Tax=Hymenobacter properus TaxID=2791026 RepID=A0A931BGZ5_9BACT|nr:ABC-F family ATP-binding cassette domain-containing protein [Hymenobacter properus]MBF9143754.1 ABC-F family ATP-binding cassette domain-containing protein [Hymenobacter properus]MBR7722567.1 ABC-F family ATP-binding cassette domain-containing protein [Microvirga sp. SRT04]
MLLLQNLGYAHPNKDVLFDGLNLAVGAHQKMALVGNNGVGKSTLLKIMAGQLAPSVGRVQASAPPYYVPQHFGQFDDLTVAQALGVEPKLKALQEILNGEATEANLETLDDDWTVEERSQQALQHWGLAELSLTQPLASLSGGQKTKVFLAGLAIHQPELVLLDEPSNHLDHAGRQLLYDFISSSASTLLVVSHDRKLLNLLDAVAELSRRGIALYGGNYDFYAEQKQLASTALHQEVKSQEKALRKARETEREALARQQKQDARGKKSQDKAGLPTIVLGMMRNSAENSGARLKGQHAEKVGALAQKLSELRNELPEVDKMKFGVADSALHQGKTLFEAHELNYGYGPRPLWSESLNFQIQSGERWALHGPNGAGKTTLLKLLTGELQPTQGTLYRAGGPAVFIDQDYSLINGQRTVYEQVQQFNTAGLQEHEVKIRLARFLFPKEYWDKPCRTLSGGEKMRLLLCCLTSSAQAPDLLILDEPTNNLDLQNLEILTTAFQDYRGTLLVVSHDAYFLEQLRVEHTIRLG